MIGVQPQEDGRLECLECGGWYRLRPPHLGAAHRMSAAEYREAHQLPRRQGLRARDLSERAREQGRARYAAREDIRATMDQGRAGGPGPDAVRSSQETAHRPGVIEARRRGGQGRRASARRRADQAAQSVGYPDLGAFFADRRGATAAAMAAELGLPRTTVGAWKQQLEDDGSIERAGAARQTG